MNNALDLVWSIVSFAGLAYIKTILGWVGCGLILWSAHLVAVQPEPARDEAGITAVQAAVMVAIPLTILGFSLMVFAWSPIS